MSNKHRIVVSAENNPYAAWMAKLFYFSCITRLHHSPIIIVHETGREWHPDFFELVKFGAIVRRAPSYRVTACGSNYQSRNTVGTLLHAAEICSDQDQFIVLCDPDLIFVRRLVFPEIFAGEYSRIMDYDRPEVAAAAQRLGITPDMIEPQKKELCCSVPYIIPGNVAGELAQMWLKAVDAFLPPTWGDMMYAFGLAAVKLGLKVSLTQMVALNHRPNAKLNADVIHYGYGDDVWSKRHYFSEDDAPKVWDPQVEGAEGTVLAEILTQIREARDFYRKSAF